MELSSSWRGGGSGKYNMAPPPPPSHCAQTRSTAADNKILNFYTWTKLVASRHRDPVPRLGLLQITTVHRVPVSLGPGALLQPQQWRVSQLGGAQSTGVPSQLFTISLDGRHFFLESASRTLLWSFYTWFYNNCFSLLILSSSRRIGRPLKHLFPMRSAGGWAKLYSERQMWAGQRSDTGLPSADILTQFS